MRPADEAEDELTREVIRVAMAIHTEPGGLGAHGG
jgi:hypothetical protein